MRKVPPSEVIREQISQALSSSGVDPEANLLSTLAQLGLSYLVQQALEQEQEDFLGRGRITSVVEAKKLGADIATVMKMPVSLPPRAR
jgi:hypothetical protein